MADLANPDEFYSYDDAGNRNPAVSTNDAADRLLSDGTESLTYDDNGNLIARHDLPTGDVTEYSYDLEWHLLRIEHVSGRTCPR